MRTNQVDDSYAGLREQDLIDVLNGLAGTTQRAQDQIQRLEATRDDLQSDTSASGRRRSSEAQQQAQVLSILAGTVPVTRPRRPDHHHEGPGAVDVDSVLDTIEELRSAGAEAMQINDEVRVVAQTSFEDGTGGLLVDGRCSSSPYVLDVIGDPHTLEGALSLIDGPVSQIGPQEPRRRRRTTAPSSPSSTSVAVESARREPAR